MRVVAFAPSLEAVEQPEGGLSLRGFPMTSAFVDTFPVEISVPLVLSVCAAAGGEYDPVRYIVATSPQGERLAALQFSWHWDDVADLPVKYRVFVQRLPLRLEGPGTYSFGLHDNPDGGPTDEICYLPVALNPAADAPRPPLV